jgi:hypothetical protein
VKLFKTLRLKWLIAVAVAMTGFVFNTRGSNATLQWDPSPDAVAGYKVYAMLFGFTPSGFGIVSTNTFDVGNTTLAMVDGLLQGQTYEFVVTAYTAAGVESDPSNDVLYSVPVTSSQFALQFGGLTHALVAYAPRGSLTSSGEMYDQGAAVTLNATVDSGYTCSGWTVNSTFYPSNPAMITMDQDTLATPVITQIGSIDPVQPGAAISLKMSAIAGQPVVTVGGELGSWVLEGSTTMTTWTQIATGLTSTQLPLSSSEPYAFYRVRSNPLNPLQ